VADAGVAQVYGGPAGAQYAHDQAVTQPVSVDLGPALAVGADPQSTAENLLKHVPGGRS
jgi:hypothetical protein